MPKQNIQTLEDIAQLANVSRSTVSRALNNSPLISKQTKERIQAIAQKHNFRINRSARNLRLRQSQTIAFVAPVYSPDFFSADDLFGLGMLRGIGKGLHSLGYDLLVIQVDSQDRNWPQAYLDSGRADGFILLTSNHNPSLVENLVAANVPFIGWGVPLPEVNYCTVTGDNFNGGRLATQHLINLGRQRIAFMGGPEGSLTIQHRLQGYQNALHAAGRGVDRGLQAFTDYSYDSGVAATQRLLEQYPELDAIFVTSDLMAIGAINLIQDRAKRVPEEIAVVGYDDLPIAVYNNLPLTTIRQDFQLVGKLLAENLVEYIRTGVVTNIITPVELVIRKSA